MVLREEISAGLDRPQGYAGFETKVRAVRDGKNRAARELAELIRADIAAALSR